MLQNRHSMTPMRREHDEIRRLVGELAEADGRDRRRSRSAWAGRSPCGGSSSSSTRCSRSTSPRSSSTSGSSSTAWRPTWPSCSRRPWSTPASGPPDRRPPAVSGEPIAGRPLPDGPADASAAPSPEPRGPMLRAPMSEPTTASADAALAIASDRDAAGVPVHRGWAPLGGHHRWMEPFVLVLLAGGARPRLRDHRRARGARDHRRLGRRRPGLPDPARPRGGGPGHARRGRPARARPRRDYELTEAGYAALDEWAAVMKERARLVGEFDARYLECGRPRPRAAERVAAAQSGSRHRRGRCPGPGRPSPRRSGSGRGRRGTAPPRRGGP